MATLTIADLDNGKRDLQTVDEVANSRAASVTTRRGQQTTTLYEAIRRIVAKGDAVLANLGYFVPVDYAPGLSVTEPNFTVVGPDGKIYAAQAGQLPFTTGAWNQGQWYPIQNVLNDHKLLVFDTQAEAQSAAATLPDGKVVEVITDETLSGARTRYKVQNGVLVFEVNLDQFRIDISQPDGAELVGYGDETLADVITRQEGLNVYVESFRKNGESTRSDSNTIRAALGHIETSLVGRMTRLIFEAGRTYIYDRTADLATINNLVIDLNGATLLRAPASQTKTTLAQDTGVGQSTLYLSSIPENWGVGDFLSAYNGNTDAKVSKNNVVILAMDRGNNRVTVNAGFGTFGGLATIIPAGTTVAKKFKAFSGRLSSAEPGVTTPPGVNFNVHIINGIIDGNASNQENNSWFFSNEILLHGRASSITGMRFRNTPGECIVGHGLRVDGNEFRNLQGSAFHLSMHDDSAALSSASWFVNNVTNGTNLATQAVNGHCEGAVTFSWGAGRLIVSGNDMLNGTESVLGGFGPSNEAQNADKWLIVSGNICRNFNRLFYDIAAPVEGVVVTDNVLIDCESSTLQMEALNKGNNSVGGNVCIGSSKVAGPFRATSAMFGGVSATIGQLGAAMGNDVPGFTMSNLSEARAAVLDPATAYAAFVTGNTGRAGSAFFTPNGRPAGDFFAQWNAGSKEYELLGNLSAGIARVTLKSAFLRLAETAVRTYADRAAAVAGGLSQGDVYQTASGQLMRVT